MATTIIDERLYPIDDMEMSRIATEYDRDGATIIRNLIPRIWIDRLAEGTERIMTSAQSSQNFNRPGEGRFFGDLFAYLRTPEYKDFLFKSGVGEAVAKIMNASTVRFFYDQPLVKEPGTPKRTPWHQDAAYWPCTGWQIMSVWVPLDAATPETGVVSYVKGSHKWNAFYPAAAWSDDGREPPSVIREGDVGLLEDPGPGATPVQARTVADIRDHPENYEFATWSVEPGDVLIHHMNTIHGAPGNLSQSRRRRAVALRFFGDDARWDDTHPHFMRMMKKIMPDFPYPEHASGDFITAPVFPVLWTKQAA